MSEPEHPPPKKPSALRRFFGLDLLDNRYPALHGLRFFAIVSVVQHHVTGAYPSPLGIAIDPAFAEFSVSIFFGMDLFFILSGFLIGSILLRSLEVHGTQNIRRFYLRRVFRTFPSYYVVLTFLAVTTTLTATQSANLIWEYVYLTNFLTLLRSDVMMFWGWSLALEEQFYLVVPVLFFVLHRLKSDRARIALLVALWASALVVRLVMFYGHRGAWGDLELYGALYFRTYTRFDTIVAGILLAFVEARYGAHIGKWLEHPFHRALLALPAMLGLWLLLRVNIFGDQHVQLVHVFAWGTVTTLMYFPALLLLLHGDGFIHRTLSWPIFRRLATLGYGVYLVHIPLLDRLLVPLAHVFLKDRVSWPWIWLCSLVCAVLLSLLVSYLLHVLVEKPSLWVRDKIAG